MKLQKRARRMVYPKLVEHRRLRRANLVNFAFWTNLPVGEGRNVKQKPCKHPIREAVRLY
jgi:hypothetical protein